MRLFLLICSMFVSNAVMAASGQDLLKSFHQKVKSLKSEFSQILFDADGGVIQESKGNVWIRRPGLFRWEYNQPYPQVIVADGRHIWIYDPELEQVTVKKEELAVGNAPALVLSGKRALEKDFKLANINRQDKYTWVSLKPLKEDRDFNEILVAFLNDKLSILELKDNLGQRTQIHFAKVSVNLALEDSRFRFIVPDGTDIIGEQNPSE